MANEGTDDYKPDPKMIEVFEKLSRQIARENKEKQEQEQEDRKPKYVDHTAIHYLKKENPSVEEVAIARGLIKIVCRGGKS
jgi:hypothetical protein